MSRCLFFDNLVVARGLQGGSLDQGGPQQVGEHVRDLAHVLIQAKVMLISPEMKILHYK